VRTHTAVWDGGDDAQFEDGTVIDTSGSTGGTGSYTYALPGENLIELITTDTDGGRDSATMMFHVEDADEALDIFNEYLQRIDGSMFKGNPNQRKTALNNMFNVLDDTWTGQEYLGMFPSEELPLLYDRRWDAVADPSRRPHHHHHGPASRPHL
jgi:hypothetical protein